MRRRGTPPCEALEGPAALAWVVVTVLLVLGFVPRVRAEPEADAPEAQLSLPSFVAEVEANSPLIEARRERTRAARARVEPARALPDPFVAIGIDQLALGRADMEGGGSAWPRPVLRYQVNQAFPLPRERRARREAASQEVGVGLAREDVTRRSLRVAATQLFLRARYLEAALQTNAALDEALADAIASARARYTTGSSAHHDVLLATAQRAVLHRDALVLERELEVLHAQMNELRGAPAGTKVPRLVDDPLASPAGRLSFGVALARQPELLGADEAVEAADARVELARTDGHPDLSVQVMAMQSLTPAMPSSLGAMLGVSVPIYWRHKQGPLVDAARAERSAAQHEREALRRRLEAEWIAAERARATSADTVGLYEAEILPATRAALESAKIAYATGEVRFSELLDVLRASLAVELEYVAAQTDVRLAQLRMDELMATPTVVRIAPSMPTLFGGGMVPGGGASMEGGAMAPTRPIGMGTGMQPPAQLDTGSGGSSMSGMGGMR